MTVPTDELLQSGLLANDDIMLPVYRPEDIGRLLGRDTLQDSVAHFDQGDLKAAMARDGRRLKSDIPPTDDEDPASGAHLARKKIRIALVAGEIDAFERATNRRRQSTRSGPRRKRQRFIAKHRAVLHDDLLCGAVDLLDPGGQTDIDIVVGIPMFRAE